MNEITDSDLKPGTLIKATYDCASFGSRYRKSELEVWLGVLLREKDTFTYVVDIREFSYISDGWRQFRPRRALSRATALQTTDQQILLQHLSPIIPYKTHHYHNPTIRLYKHHWDTIHSLLKEARLPEICALVRLKN